MSECIKIPISNASSEKTDTEIKKDYKLTVKLKQQTPLIHFQYDEPGAILRASEVKPKLDRYIIKKYKEKNKSEIPDEWTIEGTNALNYKLNIISNTISQIIIGPKTDYDIFYGNLGGSNYKEAVEADNIELNFICFIPLLFSEIKDNIEKFFITHNFGAMQGKGFGSFTKKDTKLGPEKIAEILCDEYGSKRCYYFDRGKVPFKKIKWLYSVMKSGVNPPNNTNGYQHSLLFNYMHTKDINNEKATLKQAGIAPTVFTNEVAKQQKGKNGDAKITNSKYTRALLGVGNSLVFINDSKHRNSKTTITISPGDDNEIERLPSFIFFKIIDEYVYYIGKRINKNIYGKKYVFKAKSENEKLFKPKKNEEELSVPGEDEIKNNDEKFEDAFLDYCYNKYFKDKDNSTLKKYKGTEKFETIQVWSKKNGNK